MSDSNKVDMQLSIGRVLDNLENDTTSLAIQEEAIHLMDMAKCAVLYDHSGNGPRKSLRKVLYKARKDRGNKAVQYWRDEDLHPIIVESSFVKSGDQLDIIVNFVALFGISATQLTDLLNISAWLYMAGHSYAIQNTDERAMITFEQGFPFSIDVDGHKIPCTLVCVNILEITHCAILFQIYFDKLMNWCAENIDPLNDIYLYDDLQNKYIKDKIMREINAMTNDKDKLLEEIRVNL